MELPFPIVGKPPRGRGSYGVKVCHDLAALTLHLESLAKESPIVLLEEYLAGEEATITVMPPSAPLHADYWALPVVTRFNHEDGIAPIATMAVIEPSTRKIQRQDSIAKTPSRFCYRLAAMRPKRALPI